LAADRETTASGDAMDPEQALELDDANAVRSLLAMY
jgi:hypothetical protein